MRILVTGATGFLGGWVLSSLCHEYGQENVVGTGRNIQIANKLREEGHNLLTGDLSDFKFVAASFGNIDCVVHCAGKSSLWGSYNSFHLDNVTSTQNLLEAIPGLKRFIYISTPSIYFNFEDRFDVKENSVLPDKFVNHYSETKYKAEKEVLAWDKTDIVKTIIRPRAIIGVGDTVIVPRIIRARQAGRLKIIGDGTNICDFSSVKNVAHAICLAFKGSNDIDGKVFNISDDNPLPLWPLLEDTLAKLGFESRLKKVNYRTLYILASFLETWNRIFSRGEPVLTTYGLGLLKYSLTMDIGEAKKYLSYSPIISTEDSINEFVTEYLKDGKQYGDKAV